MFSYDKPSLQPIKNSLKKEINTTAWIRHTTNRNDLSTGLTESGAVANTTFQYSRARPLLSAARLSAASPHKENFKVKSPLKSSPSELVILCLKKGSHISATKSHRLNLRWTECFFEDTILLDMEHRHNIRNHAEFIPDAGLHTVI